MSKFTNCIFKLLNMLMYNSIPGSRYNKNCQRKPQVKDSLLTRKCIATGHHWQWDSWVFWKKTQQSEGGHNMLIRRVGRPMWRHGKHLLSTVQTHGFLGASGAVRTWTQCLCFRGHEYYLNSRAQVSLDSHLDVEPRSTCWVDLSFHSASSRQEDLGCLPCLGCFPFWQVASLEEPHTLLPHPWICPWVGIKM